MKHSIRTALLHKRSALAKRLASLVSTCNLSRILRTIAPALFTVAFAGLAHAQGTMDFSGATTLMSTFRLIAVAALLWTTCPSRVELRDRSGRRSAAIRH
jgi:hypothetical protein